MMMMTAMMSMEIMVMMYDSDDEYGDYGNDVWPLFHEHNDDDIPMKSHRWW